jgi:hypothetical protein
MKDVKSWVLSCCSVLIIEIIVFFAFRRKYIWQSPKILSEALKALYKSLMFNVFGIPLSFSKIFSAILHRKLVETKLQKQIRRMP